MCQNKFNEINKTPDVFVMRSSGPYSWKVDL